MRSTSRRTLTLCVLLLGATTSFAAAAKALPCADYVSTGENDYPGEGHLIGTETRSYEVGGGFWGLTGRMTVTYEVGVYQFTGGGRLTLDCRDYTRA